MSSDASDLTISFHLIFFIDVNSQFIHTPQLKKMNYFFLSRSNKYRSMFSLIEEKFFFLHSTHLRSILILNLKQTPLPCSIGHLNSTLRNMFA